MSIREDVLCCRDILFPRDSRIISAKVEARLSRDMYETPEVLGLPKFIEPNDRVLELGAGIGFISSYLALKLNVGQITSVEANPMLCGYIERVHEINGVTGTSVINGIALSDNAAWPDDGTLAFYLTDPFWSSSLSKRDGVESTVINVPVLRLNSLIAEVKPTIIVCDIEGGEESLFESVDLSGVRGIYLELHTRIYRGSGVRKVFEDMHRHGFFYHQKASCADVVYFSK